MSTATVDPLVGQLLDGRYRVTRRLARGGMATVYTAVDSRLNREVALKVMHPGLAEDREFVDRFIREAHAAARLSHPAAVAVYDQSADSGHVFIAMEYVAGRNLRDWLRDRGRLTPRETFAVLEPVLAALAAAHQAGLVHRDIKPENVLIADDGRVKVADFGLARAVSAATSTGTLIGTVAYLAPEQVERGVADQRTDVYSAGILLYECLTGFQPHGGETPIQIAYQHVNADVPPPSAIRPSLAPALDHLVARVTCRNPAGRPPDAGAFLAELLAVRRSLSPAELDDAGPVETSYAPTVVVERGAHRASATPPPPMPQPASAPQYTSPLATPSTPFPTRPLFSPGRLARRRNRGRAALVVLLVLAVAMGLVGWRVAAGNSVSAPSLINLSRADAQTRAEQAGLHPNFSGEAFSENVKAGQVVSTDPAAGHRVAKHGTITVVLSKGPERYSVPTVSGKSVNDAKAALAGAHLAVSDQQRHDYSDTVAQGSVMGTDPAAGTALKPNAVITLIISDGGKPVRVPELVGHSIDDATKTLAKLGLKVAFDDTDFDPSGDVLAQDPVPGSRAFRGDTVHLQGSGARVTVPNVIGMSRQQATQTLQAQGLQADDEGFGLFCNTVNDQDPPAGSRVARGSQVGISC
ncbi:MAG TPA: Stk1 family PASTA domain-containing Ser/Thr kinase [Sporichthyaceae bacterium]|jgi:serine/threonine-protein kinase